MYLHVEPFKIIKNNISSRSHWKQEAEVAQHQIKSTESRCCGHNVASWWVARFAIVARHFKLFRNYSESLLSFPSLKHLIIKIVMWVKQQQTIPQSSPWWKIPQFRRQVRCFATGVSRHPFFADKVELGHRAFHLPEAWQLNWELEPPVLRLTRQNHV